MGNWVHIEKKISCKYLRLISPYTVSMLSTYVFTCKYHILVKLISFHLPVDKSIDRSIEREIEREYLRWCSSCFKKQSYYQKSISTVFKNKITILYNYYENTLLIQVNCSIFKVKQCSVHVEKKELSYVSLRKWNKNITNTYSHLGSPLLQL